MAVGGLLLLVAAVRLPSSLKDGDEGTAASGVAATGELCVGIPCRANDDPLPARGYESPTIVVDQADPMHQVVTDVNLVGARCSWHTTFDGGKTWTDGQFQLPEHYRRCQLDTAGLLPIGNVAMGAGANVYAALTSVSVAGSAAPDASGERVRAPQGESVLLASSTDGGRTWGPAREVVPGVGQDHAYVRPAISVFPAKDGGPDRILLTMWGCNGQRCAEGFFSQSLDGGQTFAAPINITPEPGGNSPSAATMTDDGTIYLTFVRRYEGAPHEIVLARSTDDGQSFQETTIDAQPGVGKRYDSVKIAVDPVRGSLYLAYSDERDVRSKVFVRRSEDQGRTWERAVRLHTSPGGSSYGPAMSVSPDGRIDVVFYKRTMNDPPTDEVRASFSTNGGRTFSPDVKISDQPIDRRIGYENEVGNHYITAVSATRDYAFAVWSDSRDGTNANNTQETFTRRLPRTATAPSG